MLCTTATNTSNTIRTGIWPVKNWVVWCWHGYLSGARCRLAYGPADATATHCLLLQWNPHWFYFFGTGSPPGSPGKRAVKRVCVVDDRFWDGSGISHTIMLIHVHVICTSLHTDNHANTSIFTSLMLLWCQIYIVRTLKLITGMIIILNVMMCACTGADKDYMLIVIQNPSE